MSRLEDNFRKVEPYVPGEQPNLPDMVKLNTNENPYPPSPKVAEALQKFELDSLRLYPDPASTDLVNALAERYHVQADQVYTGVGSDDVLAIAFLTFFNSGKPILFPDIRSMMYGQNYFKFCMSVRLWTMPLHFDWKIISAKMAVS